MDKPHGQKGRYMHAYQQRAVDEKIALDGKIEKLSDFMHSEDYGSLDATNKGLLMVQLVAMEGYSKALERRIELL